jgi:multiple sugar transport system substrate-binding protein
VPLEDLPGAQELFARLDERTVVQDLGHNYYVPLGVDITMMIYNKELFEEAGLDPESPPGTWDEFIAAAEAIDALPTREDGSDVSGTVFWNEALAWGGWYWNMLQPIYLNGNQNQCQLLNRLSTDIVFDQPDCNMAGFFDFTRQAQQHAPPTMEKNFFSRNVGMWLQYGYSWEPNLQTAAERPMVIGEDVAVAPVPVPNEGDTSYTTLGGRPLMIMRTNPEREAAAWEFVKFLMEDENNLQFIKELGYLPAITALQGDSYFAEPARQPFVDMLENAVYPQPLANFDAAANAVLGVYQQAVVEGEMTPEEATAAAAEQARKAIQQQ